MAELAFHEELLPWDRQHGEPSKLYHAFCHFKDMGAGVRSIDKSWRDHQVKCLHRPEQDVSKKRANPTWMQASGPWGWVVRAESWDAEAYRLAGLQQMKARVDAAIRHARTAQSHLQVGVVMTRASLELVQHPEVLQRMIQAGLDSNAGAMKLIALAVENSRAVPGLVDVERLSLGMNTEVIQLDDRRERSIGDRIREDPIALDMAIALEDRMSGTTNGNDDHHDVEKK